MRKIKIISNDSLSKFERELNEFIAQYPDAIVDYKPVQYGNYSVTYTVLIEYKTSE